MLRFTRLLSLPILILLRVPFCSERITIVKPFLSAAVVCLFSSLLAAQSTTSFHSAAPGAFVVANANGTAINIDVNRGDTSTLLEVFATTPGPNSGSTMTIAFGSIPNNDFVNSGQERMSLNVDTSQVPGFQSTTCTISFTPSFSETCGQGPLGVIQINWISNHIKGFTFVEEQHQDLIGLTIDLHFNGDVISANASGSYLGSSFPATNDAGTRLNRDTTIIITH